MVKTHLRDMIIVPEMIGSVVGVYVSSAAAPMFAVSPVPPAPSAPSAPPVPPVPPAAFSLVDRTVRSILWIGNICGVAFGEIA
jgi:hypothetical protein